MGTFALLFIFFSVVFNWLVVQEPDSIAFKTKCNTTINQNCSNCKEPLDWTFSRLCKKCIQDPPIPKKVEKFYYDELSGF